MKLESQLLIALFVVGLAAFWYMASYLDARGSLRTTCEAVSKEHARFDESNLSTWLEAAYEACSEADALP